RHQRGRGVKTIADCQFPIADLEIGVRRAILKVDNRQLAIGNWRKQSVSIPTRKDATGARL
ncbi:MAG TPA: hypothetical protein VM656_10790, partial [Pyrinomonadaceae bacterium]|nr:hypothetical protein [Pyrinomonadaceae bacterium]